MPAAKTRDQGKTSFVKELLDDDPMANTKIVNEAWAKAGMDGTISETLVNKTRSFMGFAGNLRGKSGKKSKPQTSAKPAYKGKKRGRKPKQEVSVIAEIKGTKNGTRVGNRSERLVEIEAEFDRLLFRVMNIGQLVDVENALREARRRLYDAFLNKR